MSDLPKVFFFSYLGFRVRINNAGDDDLHAQIGVHPRLVNLDLGFVWKKGQKMKFWQPGDFGNSGFGLMTSLNMWCDSHPRNQIHSTQFKSRKGRRKYYQPQQCQSQKGRILNKSKFSKEVLKYFEVLFLKRLRFCWFHETNDVTIWTHLVPRNL